MAAPPVEIERDLYRGPLADFIARRQALAKQLRSAGDARAAAVAKLGKPSPSAWAVSQLFAREPRAMAALVGAGEKARAEERGGRNPRAVRQALTTIGSETGRLLARGVALLTEGGGAAPSAAIVERLRTNLDALALDPRNDAVAARGWLDRDLEAPGFEALAGLQIAAAAETKPGATVHRLEDGRKISAARRERERLERVDRLEALRREVARTEAEEAGAQHAAERAREEETAAERRATEARRNSTEAQRRLSNAAEAARRARAELERNA
jgi:hypothetical protein